MLGKSGRRNDGRCSRRTATNPATDSTNKRKATRNLETRFMLRRSVHDAVKNSGDLFHFRRQFRKLLGQDRLHAVRKRFLRVVVHFHKQSICADRDRGTGEGKHLVAFPGAMAWVHKDRQVAALFYGGGPHPGGGVGGKRGKSFDGAPREDRIFNCFSQE